MSAICVWTATKMTDHPRKHRTLTLLMVAMTLLAATYVGAYLASVTPGEAVQIYPLPTWGRTPSTIPTGGILEPRYRFAQGTLRIVFWPVAQLDPRKRSVSEQTYQYSWWQ
jgi:hypothetical protein